MPIEKEESFRRESSRSPGGFCQYFPGVTPNSRLKERRNAE